MDLMVQNVNGGILNILLTSSMDGPKERGDGKGGEGEREGDVGHRGHIVICDVAITVLCRGALNRQNDNCHTSVTI